MSQVIAPGYEPRSSLYLISLNATSIRKSRGTIKVRARVGLSQFSNFQTLKRKRTGGERGCGEKGDKGERERERERIDEHVPYTMGPRGKKTVVFAEKLTESNEYDEDEAIAKAPTAKATGQDAGKSSGKGEENRFKHFLDPIRSAS